MSHPLRVTRLSAAVLAMALAVTAGATPAAAEGGIFSGLLPVAGSELGAADLASFAAGAPLVLSGFDSQGGGSALGDAAVAPDAGAGVTVHSSAQASATLTASPVSLAEGGQIATGGFGDVAMENGAGLAGAQLASGLGNIQQNTVSFVFVLSGLPQ